MLTKSLKTDGELGNKKSTLILPEPPINFVISKSESARHYTSFDVKGKKVYSTDYKILMCKK